MYGMATERRVDGLSGEELLLMAVRKVGDRTTRRAINAELDLRAHGAAGAARDGGPGDGASLMRWLSAVARPRG